MDLAKVIGSNIRKLMELNSVSAVDLAKALSITRQTLQNYLKGTSIIDSVKLVEVAKLFSVPVTTLLETDKTDSVFLYRTTLHAESAHNNLQDKISTTIDNYYNLAKSLGKQIAFFPEQYNLNIEFNDNRFDINFDETFFSNKKINITNQLRNEIKAIAYEQRALLGITDGNALNAISLLQKRGINIFFVDFGETTTNGLSYVDDEKGCYIIVNNNHNLTLERIIFTVFHEYAHILLHRPFYKRKAIRYDENKSQFLDRMADTFAGFFLVPQELLYSYEEILGPSLHFKELYPIKHFFQVSLQTLMMALKNYNYISSAYVSKFFAFLEKNNLKKVEPFPLLDIPAIKSSYESIANSSVLSILQEGYIKDLVDSNLIKNILWVDDEQAESIINQFKNYHAFNDDLDAFLKEIL